MFNFCSGQVHLKVCMVGGTDLLLNYSCWLNRSNKYSEMYCMVMIGLTRLWKPQCTLYLEFIGYKYAGLPLFLALFYRQSNCWSHAYGIQKRILNLNICSCTVLYCTVCLYSISLVPLHHTMMWYCMMASVCVSVKRKVRTRSLQPLLSFQLLYKEHCMQEN